MHYVTEFKYGERFENKLYLSTIIDLYDRYPISYVMSDHNNNPLVFDTFEKILGAVFAFLALTVQLCLTLRTLLLIRE